MTPRLSARQSSDSTREARLVFQLAGASPQWVAADADATSLEWSLVLQLAAQENAVFAVRDHLRRFSPGMVPTAVERQVTILSLDREFRMRRLRQRFEESVAALNATGSVPLLLKGAALASTTYGSFVARPMRDIDFLVNAGDAQAVGNLMLRTGWIHDPSLPDNRIYAGHHHLAPLLDGSGTGLRLEIHRELLPAGHPFRYTINELFASARSASVGSGRALVMCAAHHAVYAAIHFAWSHMMQVGSWHTFRDLITIERAGDLDWSEFAEIAKRWGAGTCCYWTLRLGRALSGLTVPGAVLHRLQPSLPRAALTRLERHFTQFLLRNELSCPSVGLDRLFWTTAIQPGRQGHGAVRPWLVSPELRVARGETMRTSSSRRVLLQMSNARRWGLYLAALL